MKKIKHLRHMGKLILIVHHDLSKADQYFDRILLLNQSLQFWGQQRSPII